MCKQYDGDFIPLGHGGTIVNRSPATIRVLSEHVVEWIRIEQTITLTLDVPVDRTELARCVRCATLPPLPDAAAAEYILANHDGARLLFPREGDVGAERDQYPVTGWEAVSLVNPIDDGIGLLCTACAREWREANARFLAAGKTKRRT